MKDDMIWRLNGWGSIFRLITPMLVTINLFILGQVWGQLGELNGKVFAHQIDTTIHTTQSEIAALRATLAEMQKEIIATIRQAGKR